MLLYMSFKNQRSGNPVAALIKAKICPFLSTFLISRKTVPLKLQYLVKVFCWIRFHSASSASSLSALAIASSFSSATSSLTTWKRQSHEMFTNQSYTLQMKGRWESNINVWLPFMYSQKWNCYFQNGIVMLCLRVPTLIYLWEIYIFPRICREIQYMDQSCEYINRS